jgi:hypothetical protein
VVLDDALAQVHLGSVETQPPQYVSRDAGTLPLMVDEPDAPSFIDRPSAGFAGIMEQCRQFECNCARSVRTKRPADMGSYLLGEGDQNLEPSEGFVGPALGCALALAVVLPFTGTILVSATRQQLVHDCLKGTQRLEGVSQCVPAMGWWLREIPEWLQFRNECNEQS